MNTETIVVLAYFGLMSVVCFLQYGIDKRKAIKGRYRIRESVLLSVSFLGGALGAIVGMYLFRHKTLHFRFHLVNFLGIVWQALLILLLEGVIVLSFLPL